MRVGERGGSRVVGVKDGVGGARGVQLPEAEGGVARAFWSLEEGVVVMKGFFVGDVAVGVAGWFEAGEGVEGDSGRRKGEAGEEGRLKGEVRGEP